MLLPCCMLAVFYLWSLLFFTGGCWAIFAGAICGIVAIDFLCLLLSILLTATVVPSVHQLDPGSCPRQRASWWLSRVPQSMQTQMCCESSLGVLYSNFPPPLSPPIFIHTSSSGINPSCHVSSLQLYKQYYFISCVFIFHYHQSTFRRSPKAM